MTFNKIEQKKIPIGDSELHAIVDHYLVVSSVDKNGSITISTYDILTGKLIKKFNIGEQLIREPNQTILMPLYPDKFIFFRKINLVEIWNINGKKIWTYNTKNVLVHFITSYHDTFYIVAYKDDDSIKIYRIKNREKHMILKLDHLYSRLFPCSDHSFIVYEQDEASFKLYDFNTQKWKTLLVNNLAKNKDFRTNLCMNDHYFTVQRADFIFFRYNLLNDKIIKIDSPIKNLGTSQSAINNNFFAFSVENILYIYFFKNKKWTKHPFNKKTIY
jgi:hypothetical protein